MRARCAMWLAILATGCGSEPSGQLAPDASAPDASERDASDPPSSGTTARECLAGIALTPDAPDPRIEIARFVTVGGKYQIVRARESAGGRGFSTFYHLARVWIDGGEEQGRCVTDRDATTYSSTHHNFDDRYTVTTDQATYAFHESVAFANSDSTWLKTLEVRDANGSVIEDPLMLLDVCSAVITREQQGQPIVCLPTEPPVDPDADADDWEGCPTADAFLPFAEGAGLLTVDEHAVYCAAFRPDRTLKETFASRAMLRFTPGAYSLPIAETANYRMPACVRVQPASEPLTTQPAPLTHALELVDWQDVHRYTLDAPLEGLERAMLRAQLELVVDNDALAHTTLAGQPNLPLMLGASDGTRNAFELCTEGEPCEQPNMLDSCLPAFDATHVQHLITFENGDMLSVKLSFSSGPYARTSFDIAWGRWRGQDFQQRDRFKLIYAAPSDHSTRSVAVLFDEPIDGACGLRVSSIDPLDPSAGTAATVDCELEDIDAIAITSTDLPSL